MFEATSREFMNSDLRNHHHHQQQQGSYGLMRYNSAPSSFFANHLNSGGGGGGGGGGGSQHFESMFPGFMSCDGSGDSDSHNMHEAAGLVLPQQNGYSAASSQMMYQNTVPVHHLPNHDSAKMSGTTSIESSFRVMNPMQVKTAGTGNCSNLIRQNSSPAGGLFSKLTLENGFAVMRDGRNFSAGNGTNNGETSPSTSRLNNHISFSSRPSSCSRLLPQIAEIGNESIGASSAESRNLGNGNGSDRCYIPGFANDSWDDCTFPGLKRIRESDERMFCVETQNEDSGNHTHGLIHHLSLPKTSTEMADVEKYLKFQGNIPCKIRAKRGCATHPRSIAERVRRTRISERMRKLQDLFPNMDKQTNTADMLDLAVEYIKNLQKQVKKLTDTNVNCTCSSIKKQYSHESYPTA